jgi:hypothetical protein
MEKITGSHKGDQEFIPEKKLIKYEKVIIPDSKGELVLLQYA